MDAAACAWCFGCVDAAADRAGGAVVRQPGPRWRVWIGEFVIGIWWRPEPGVLAAYRTAIGGNGWICGVGLGRWDLIFGRAGNR